MRVFSSCSLKRHVEWWNHVTPWGFTPELSTFTAADIEDDGHSSRFHQPILRTVGAFSEWECVVTWPSHKATAWHRHLDLLKGRTPAFLDSARNYIKIVCLALSSSRLSTHTSCHLGWSHWQPYIRGTHEPHVVVRICIYTKSKQAPGPYWPKFLAENVKNS